MATVKPFTFVDNFCEVLENNGDMFFSCGDVVQDMELIKSTIDTQGYWSGFELRYYFDEDYNLLNTEERRFGV